MLKTYLIPSCLPTVEKNGANTARDFVNKIYLSLFAEKDFFFSLILKQRDRLQFITMVSFPSLFEQLTMILVKSKPKYISFKKNSDVKILDTLLKHS